MNHLKVTECEDGFLVDGRIFKEEKDAKAYLDLIDSRPKPKKNLADYTEDEKRKLPTHEKLILLMRPSKEDKKSKVSTNKKLFLLITTFVTANIITGIFIAGIWDFVKHFGYFVRLSLLFPLGLYFYLISILNPVFGKIIGWIFYASFFTLIMLSKNKARFKTLFSIWICVLVLNIGGCTLVMRAIGSIS